MNSKGSFGRQTRNARTPESSRHHFGAPVDSAARLLVFLTLEVPAKSIPHEKRPIWPEVSHLAGYCGTHEA